MKILTWITSFIAWLQIVFSPLFFGCVFGLIVYGIYPTTTGLVVGILIAALGLIAGIIFATRVWKKKGTVDFISRVSASPELDDLEKDGKTMQKQKE
ncbi:hypothetical protein [Ferruginibacter sp.]